TKGHLLAPSCVRCLQCLGVAPNLLAGENRLARMETVQARPHPIRRHEAWHPGMEATGSARAIRARHLRGLPSRRFAPDAPAESWPATDRQIQLHRVPSP